MFTGKPIEMPEDIPIKLAPGAEEIGLAVMLEQLLVQNLEQNPHKTKDFKRLNIGVGLDVTDVGISLTMAFTGGLLTIHPGIKDSPKLKIATESDIIMALSNQKIKWGLPYYFDETGQEIMQAMKSGRLKLKGMIKHFVSLVRLSKVMSVH